jgi:hypothetical protein
MSVRGTLGLLAALALLVSYLLAVDPPAARLPEPEDPLLTVPASRVNTLAVNWPDARLRIVRHDGAWHGDGHDALPAGMVDDFLAALGTIHPTDALTPSGADATDYGLGPAATMLTVSAGDAPILQLQVGDRNPAWTGVYVRRTGSTEILLVGALLHWELQKLHSAAPR